jgi:probable rRNA maturation factor
VRIEVEISDTQGHLKVDRSALSALVRTVLSAERRESASISIALVDNATIHAVNRTHLDHDWPTDVISFPLSDPDDPILAGELVVSAEMAGASALERDVDPEVELDLYVVHGLLHLCGYDDQSEGDVLRMRLREHELLAEAGLKNPFPLVGRSRLPIEDEVLPEPKLSLGPAISATSISLSRSVPKHSEPRPWSG